MKAISFIKNNAIAMSIALAAVIGFSAFKMASPATQMAEFVFTLNPGGSPTNAADYTYSPAGTPCEDGSEICAVSNEHDNTLTQPELNSILNQEEGRIYWKD